MGYCISMEIESFFISKSNMKGALVAINKLDEPYYRNQYGRGGTWMGGKKTDGHFSWVDGGPYETLKEALEDWRYEVEEKDDGFYITEFTGEKLGDDDYLYQAIAPFVVSGYIGIVGEDGEAWSYTFEGGKVKSDGGMRKFHW